jgi:hypothetical protein
MAALQNYKLTFWLVLFRSVSQQNSSCLLHHGAASPQSTCSDNKTPIFNLANTVSLKLSKSVASDSDHRNQLRRIWGSHSGGYGEFCRLGYIAVQSCESVQPFGGTSLPASGWKNKPSKRSACCLLHAGFWVASEKIDFTDYTVLNSRK